jgi:hypothetical protein
MEKFSYWRYSVTESYGSSFLAIAMASLMDRCSGWVSVHADDNSYLLLLPFVSLCLTIS